jgi:ATP-binding cassette subfamily B protein/subfamily B ATP-binding cassette protein MsbA
MTAFQGRWSRRAAWPIIVVAAFAVLGGFASASASTPSVEFGWWYEGNQAAIGDVSAPPPGAPADGLYFAAGPSGGLSVGAIRFIPDGLGPTTVVLDALDDSFDATTSVLACPAAGTWEPVQAGEWSARPAADCAAVGGGVEGAPAADGSTMTWTLDPAFADGSGAYDIVFLPQGPVPYDVPVAAPAADSFVLPVATTPPPPPEVARGPSSAPVTSAAAVAAAPAGPTVLASAAPGTGPVAPTTVAAPTTVETPSTETSSGSTGGWMPLYLVAIAAAVALALITGEQWKRIRRFLGRRERDGDGNVVPLGRGRPAPTKGASVERRLFRYLRPYWRGVLAAFGITVSAVLVGLAKPWPTKILVDDVLGTEQLFGFGKQAALAASVLLTLVIFLVSGALGILQTRVVTGLSQRLLQDMRGQLFGHLTRLSLRFHDERGIGDTAYRVTTDTYAVQSILLNGLLPTAAALFQLIGTLVIMIRLDVQLALLALVSAPIAIVVTKRFGTFIRRYSLEYTQRESDVYTHAEQALAGIRTVQAFAREQYETNRFQGHVAASRTAMMRLVTLQTLFGLAISGILALGMATVTWFAAQRAISGELSTGEVLVILAYAGGLFGPISGLTSVFADLQKAAAGAGRVFEVLDLPQPPNTAAIADVPDRAKGHIRMEGVGFAYSPGVPVLADIDLEAKPGQLVALVGPTGAGKSTLASLVLRLYDPDEGRVLLDGVDLRDLPLEWVREQVAFVPQEPLLFPISVRENIRYGRLEATDDEVEQAARDANILDELLVDPRGLDAPLGERGVTLSGGQRQRVALARAFLRDSPVVLLDEPTSALDAGTEMLIMDALDRLAANRTTIVIAHRLATVHRANRVIVLEHGRLTQIGTHRQLIRRRGRYRDLHEARFGPERAAASVR